MCKHFFGRQERAQKLLYQILLCMFPFPHGYTCVSISSGLDVFMQGLSPLPSGGLLIASTSNPGDVTGLYQCTVTFPNGQNISLALYDVQHIEGKLVDVY